jgi:exonuclease SbcD
MPIRIVHTADNHIGLNFKQYPIIRNRLIQERFDALERIIAESNNKQTHFLVVAGDLFDKISLSNADIRKTVTILKQFSGQAVLVLAGNHDYYDGPENKLWKEFSDSCRDSDLIHPMLNPGVHTFECEGETIHFYACPCPSKLGKDSMIHWAASAPKEEGHWHIGIAHGNVEGIGLDADQRYFNMKPADLKNAGMHTWLLGHIHVPYPDAGMVGSPDFFMPGIHTPDSVKVKHSGHAWLLELEQGREIRFRSINPGAIRFERIALQLKNSEDIDLLKKQIKGFESDKQVLELQLSGSLSGEMRRHLADWMKQQTTRFLHLEADMNDIHEQLDPAQLEKYWPEGSLPFEWIQELLRKEKTGSEDAVLAMELLEIARNQC